LRFALALGNASSKNACRATLSSVVPSPAAPNMYGVRSVSVSRNTRPEASANEVRGLAVTYDEVSELS
jgi:hypothetical protein